MPWFWGKMLELGSSVGLTSHLKSCFFFLGKKISEIFSAGPSFRMFQIKCLSKCPYFQKPPLPWKILGYAPLQLTEWTDLNVFCNLHCKAKNIWHFWNIFLFKSTFFTLISLYQHHTPWQKIANFDFLDLNRSKMHISGPNTAIEFTIFELV